MPRPTQLTLALAGATTLALGAARPAAAPRAEGRIVRVERPRAAAAVPRVCDVRDGSEGICLGAAPHRGDAITLLTETGAIAVVRIVEVTPFGPGSLGAATPSAGCASLWMVKTELVRGDPAGSEALRIGVIDPHLDARRARVLRGDAMPASPSGSDEDQVMAALDRDGDGAADLVLTGGPCEDGAGAGVTRPTMCLDAWAPTAGKLARVQRLDLSQCGL